jgi:hypothetical protein
MKLQYKLFLKENLFLDDLTILIALFIKKNNINQINYNNNNYFFYNNIIFYYYKIFLFIYKNTEEGYEYLELLIKWILFMNLKITNNSNNINDYNINIIMDEFNRDLKYFYIDVIS